MALQFLCNDIFLTDIIADDRLKFSEIYTPPQNGILGTPLYYYLKTAAYVIEDEVVVE